MDARWRGLALVRIDLISSVFPPDRSLSTNSYSKAIQSESKFYSIEVSSRTMRQVTRVLPKLK